MKHIILSFFILLSPQTSNQNFLLSPKNPQAKLSKTDVELLARIIFAEAGGEPFEGQWAVADVVLNTAMERRWSLEKTVFSGRFHGAFTGAFRVKNIPKSCIRAAKRSLSGHHILPPGVMYFYNPMSATNTGWIQFISKYKYRMIGRHIFCWNPENIT